MIRNSDLLVINAKIRRLLEPQKSLFGDVHSKIHRNLHIVVKKVLYFKIGNVSENELTSVFVFLFNLSLSGLPRMFLIRRP